ncbi:MAG: hypothetical protein JWO56_646 [Acidobacteria bacterium]|nr:hypothetical protein [Acidobacteriota bacterium]
MTAILHSDVRFIRARPGLAARMALVVLFWGAAALLVVSTQPLIEGFSTAAKVGAIVVAAWAYMRFAARNARIDHALYVGLAWLTLDIVAEIATTSTLGRGWFELIGSPARPLLRDLLLGTWIGAPALFSRYE